MTERPRVLVVDDETTNLKALCDILGEHGFDVEGRDRAADALAVLEGWSADILLTDLRMPEMNGVELLGRALEIDPHIVGILMTGQGSIGTAVSAMQAGALDYVLKPLTVSTLLPVLRRGLEIRRLRLENLELRDTVAIQGINQAIAHTTDIVALPERVAEAALEHFGADEASVMVLTPDGNALRVAAVKGGDRETLVGEILPLGRGIAGHVAATGEPWLSPGGADAVVEVRPAHPRTAIRSSLSMPMMTRGKLVGVLNVSCIAKAQNIPKGRVKAFEIFTSAAAAALEAARLHEEERSAQARYAEVLDTAPDGIISIDGDQTIRIFNRGAERIFGYSATEVLGKPLTTLLPPRVAGVHQQYVDAFVAGADVSRTMAGGEPLAARRKDGSLIHLELAISKHTERGHVFCTAVVRDVTERLGLEAQLRQAQKMEEVGQLTGGIAHDFNNVLTVIISNGEVIERATPPDAAYREDLTELLGAAKRGARLVSRLLQFSRREVLSMKPTGLGGIITEVVPMVERLLDPSIQFEVSDRTAPTDVVMVDRGAVEQMVLNLCTNARDAMPGGGTLTVDCSSTVLDAGYHATHPWVTPGRYTLLSVTDTGSGMDEATQRRVFEPFFTTKEAGKGTGLGLSMVYGLMKQHGGMAHVYSEPGEGTTIKLYFPIVADAEAPAEGHPERPKNEAVTRGSETVLVVEDDEGIRRATRRALEGHGYAVLTAADGEEALEVLERETGRVALVISDLAMPKLGGRQLAAAMRQTGAEIPILFTSGHSREAAMDNGLPSDAHFLQKPWTLQNLFTYVRRVLDGEE